MRPSGAVSLTVPVLGDSLNMLVSITFPDLISLLCFPVQLHSISLAVGNGDSYINLLNTHWCRERTSGQRKRENRRDKDRNVEREQMKKDLCTPYLCQKEKRKKNLTKMQLNIRLWKPWSQSEFKATSLEVTLSTVCTCLLVTWARWFCQAVRAERVRETTFATVLLL